MKSLPSLFGGVEAGGTKFNCVVGRSASEITARASFPTTTPKETLANALAFFTREIETQGPIAAMGVACFGPVDLNPRSARYGYITETPKPYWSNTDVLGAIAGELKVPAAFDTDVNGSALGELTLGAAQGLEDFVYVTIGTGVGAGIFANRQPIKGSMHPEIGHLLMPHDRERDPFPGACPFHGNCLEGMAAGPSLEKRWGCKAETLPPDHEAWSLQADYLAAMCWNITAAYSPQRIILGGGVMKQAHLFPKIRDRFLRVMNGYPCGAAARDPEHYIVPPKLGGHAGEAGAILMAQAVAEEIAGTLAV